MTKEQEGKRGKILWVSDHPGFVHVGQSRVGREVVSRLCSEWDVAYAGFGDPSKTPNAVTGFPYQVIGITRWDTGLLRNTILAATPDIVILSHDCWLFPKLPYLVQEFPNIKWIGWFTIDGHPLPVRWKPIFEACDKVLVPSTYGKNMVSKQWFHIKPKVVPYGVDRNMFHPPTAKEKARLKSTLPRPGGFAALFVGQNQSRKNLGAVLDGWKLFVADKSDASLIIVTHSKSVQKGEWIVRSDFDLQEWGGVPGLVLIDGYVPHGRLGSFFQTADVFVLPTIGEGFGLPIIEAMASGCLPIVTGYSGHTQFCNESNSVFLPGIDFRGEWGVCRRFVPADVVAEALGETYRLWKTGDRIFTDMVQAGLATTEPYTWDWVASLISKHALASLETPKLDLARTAFLLKGEV